MHQIIFDVPRKKEIFDVTSMQSAANKHVQQLQCSFFWSIQLE
jgi:hypothetical protein